MARLLLLDVENEVVKEVEVGQSDLDKFHTLLNCRCFDITSRQIGGRYFDIFCDDEGLLMDDPKISAIDIELQPMLVGNLIFANHDGEGNTTDLSDDDIQHIRKNIKHICTNKYPLGYPMLMCAY